MLGENIYSWLPKDPHFKEWEKTSSHTDMDTMIRAYITYLQTALAINTEPDE